MNIVYNGENDARLGKAVMGETIISILENDPKVVYLDSDLMSCIGTVKYAAAHPDRAIECGISEANMIGVGCGMAAEGYKPICHSFGIFASRRCFDQLFLSAGYAKNDITVLGTDPGVTAAMNGGDDFRLLFTIPILQMEKFRHDFQTFDIIGHLAQPEAGAVLVTPEGVELPLSAQGWNK